MLKHAPIHAPIRDDAPQSFNGAAGTRPSYEDLIRQLTAEDRDAIEALVHDPPRRPIASQQAFRLLELGLAELVCGRLVLTRGGKVARMVLRDLHDMGGGKVGKKLTP